jgi:CxxC-x17-CxxC domain-containing protein
VLGRLFSPTGGHESPAEIITIIQGERTSLMDKSLVCRECGATFVFTQGEQEFYQTHGLTNQPTRCPTCRAARRAQQGGSPTATSPTATTSTFVRPPMEARQLYPATCARCGQPTQVPFQPRGDRPVYCSSCFQQERLSAPAAPFAPRSAPSFRPATPVAVEAPPDPRRDRWAERKPDKPERERKQPRRKTWDSAIEDHDDEDW